MTAQPVDEYNRSARIQSLAIALCICFAFFEMNDAYKRGCVRDERVAFINQITQTEDWKHTSAHYNYGSSSMIITYPQVEDSKSVTCTNYIRLK